MGNNICEISFLIFIMKNVLQQLLFAAVFAAFLHLAFYPTSTVKSGGTEFCPWIK